MVISGVVEPPIHIAVIAVKTIHDNQYLGL
jgi:hypothetical protein